MSNIYKATNGFQKIRLGVYMLQYLQWHSLKVLYIKQCQSSPCIKCTLISQNCVYLTHYFMGIKPTHQVTNGFTVAYATLQ